VIVITGAAGQLGQAVTRELVARGVPVMGVDIAEKPNTVDASVAWIRVNLADCPTDFSWPCEAVAVLHLAGSTTATKLSHSSVRHWLNSNAVTTGTALAACQATVQRFVYVSSISVYGQATDSPLTENSVTAPVTGYGVSKLLGEMACRLHIETGAMNPSALVVLRLAQVYGPGTSTENALYRLIRQAIDHRRLDLTCTEGLRRDYMFVSDAAQALRLAVLACPGGLYNVGYGRPVTMGELAVAIARSTPGCDHPRFSPTDSLAEFHLTLLADRFFEATGFRPRVSPSEGIAGEAARLMEKTSEHR
jgi:UDP-glucuronate 4-epimerase